MIVKLKKGDRGIRGKSWELSVILFMRFIMLMLYYNNIFNKYIIYIIVYNFNKIRSLFFKWDSLEEELVIKFAASRGPRGMFTPRG